MRDQPLWPAYQDPVGIPEIANLLGVRRATVDQWRARGLLPDPDYPRTVGGRRPWKAGTIRSWAIATNRVPAVQSRHVARNGSMGVIDHYWLGPDDEWELCCSWVVSGAEGVRTAYPSKRLKQMARDPELVAWQHMQGWEQLRIRWAEAHGNGSGEEMPATILEFPS